MKEVIKVGVSGVRGVVGASFTPQLAASFAQAFGTFVGEGAVIVGRDTRSTGPMIEHAVVAGLQSVGCKPVVVGVIPTPSLLYLVNEEGARGGIMITASHNSVEWNALKFIERRGLFLGSIHAEEFFDIYHQREFPLVGESAIPSAAIRQHAVEPHFDRVTSYVDASAIRDAGLRVAVDCCNGVGAVYTRAFLEERMGCTVFPLFDDPSGVFERDPEPLSEHLGALQDLVRERDCHVGFAQDPDGDRLAVLDETGRPIGEEITVALAVGAVLRHHGRGPVAANLSSGKRVEHVAHSFGVDVLWTKTGEIHVAEAMRDGGAVVGGEHTGGIIIPAIHPCRDSYGGMAVILELMALTGRTISELCSDIPRYCLIKDKIPVGTDQAPGILRNLRRTYAEYPMNTLDGLHIDFGDRWVHIRLSNTEPVLRIIAEAPSKGDCAALVTEVRARVEEGMAGPNR